MSNQSAAMESYRNKKLFPVGIIIKEQDNNKISKLWIVAIYESRVVSFEIIKTEKVESPYSYAASSMYEKVVVHYAVGVRRNHDLLSVRDNSYLMHYRYDSPMVAIDGYELFESITRYLKKNPKGEEINGFTKEHDFNGSVLNMMCTENAERKGNVNFLDVQEDCIQVHPENLEEAKMLFRENQRLFKVWRSDI